MSVNELIQLVLGQGAPAVIGSFITWIYLTSKSDNTTTTENIEKYLSGIRDDVKQVRDDVKGVKIDMDKGFGSVRRDVSTLSTRVSILETREEMRRNT